MGNRSESQRVEWLIIRDILILREGQEFKNRDYNYLKVIRKRTKNKIERERKIKLTLAVLSVKII